MGRAPNRVGDAIRLRALNTRSSASSPMASLEDLALDLASSYAHRRETLLRQQDAAVRAAEEKARPVKREKRLADGPGHASYNPTYSPPRRV